MLRGRTALAALVRLGAGVAVRLVMGAREERVGLGPRVESLS